jgi:hypothetical protein
MNPVSAAATNRNSRRKKATPALLAGIWATHVAWRRGGAAPPGMALGWPERCIGPVLIGFAVAEFAVVR